MQNLTYQKCITSFLDASETILKFFSFNIQKIEQIEDEQIDSILKPELAVFIGISGNPNGNLSLEMDNHTALEIVSLMNNTSHSDFSAMAFGSLNELANQIAGKAITIISSYEYNSYITPPLIIKGKNFMLQQLDNDNLSIHKIDTDIGQLWLKLFLKLD